MIKHKSQRVGVFMDVQNMYYSAKKLYNSKVNFGAILETAVADRQLIRAIAYVVRATGDEGKFFEALKHRGLETKERPVQVFESGAKKADWDVGMTVDAIRIGEILDVIVLVSGDGDFVELVDYLKHHGRQVEVIAFRETTSSKLVQVADDFIDLSQEMSKYLIKPPTGDAKRNPQRGRGPRPPKGGAVEREVSNSDTKALIPDPRKSGQRRDAPRPAAPPRPPESRNDDDRDAEDGPRIYTGSDDE